MKSPEHQCVGTTREGRRCKRNVASQGSTCGTCLGIQTGASDATHELDHEVDMEMSVSGVLAHDSDYPLTREGGGWYGAARDAAGEDGTPEPVQVPPKTLKAIFCNRIMGNGHPEDFSMLRVQVTPEGTWYRSACTPEGSKAEVMLEVFDPLTCGPEEEYSIGKEHLKSIANDPELTSVPDFYVRHGQHSSRSAPDTDEADGTYSSGPAPDYAAAHGTGLTLWASEEGKPSTLTRLEAVSLSAEHSRDRGEPKLSVINLRQLEDGRLRVESSDAFRLAWDTLPNPWADSEDGPPVEIPEKPPKVGGLAWEVESVSLLSNAVRKIHGPDAVDKAGVSINFSKPPDREHGYDTQMVAGQVRVSCSRKHDNGFSFPNARKIIPKERVETPPWVAVNCSDLARTLSQYTPIEGDGEKPNKSAYTEKQSLNQTAHIRQKAGESNAQVALEVEIGKYPNDYRLVTEERSMPSSATPRDPDSEHLSASFNAGLLRGVSKWGDTVGAREVHLIPSLNKDGSPSSNYPFLVRCGQDSSAADRGMMLMAIRNT